MKAKIPFGEVKPTLHRIFSFYYARVIRSLFRYDEKMCNLYQYCILLQGYISEEKNNFY